ncbi:MAG: hypothetical protein PHX87_05725 [Candidatus Peribacteraceae bacterium]|nr:hypothetical protein [Candidatus Peribacteraceae bacterium]MDD5742891.1 hypothetical protein [Candidatus Peribacteraceae bacterium]
MILRTFRTSFILAGLAILVSTAGDVHGVIRANLTGQESMLTDVAIEKMSTAEIRQHMSAPEQTKRSTSASIALGSILLLLGLGLHAYLKRRHTDERAVKVHAAPVNYGRDKRKMDRWFLWMTVKM